MPSEWKHISLRDAGVTLIDCDHRTPPAVDSGYPYVSIPQLRQGRIEIDDARKITAEHFEEWTRKAKPQAYDVVLSRRCNPGETAFVAPHMEFALGQNLVLLRADGTKVYPPFLRWLVRSPDWWGEVERFINVGAVFNSLKCADIPKFSLPIPEVTEQQSIADTLGALDDKIALLRETNATLEAIAQALFKSWFVDFDPVRAKAEGRDPVGVPPEVADLFPSEFENSELGEIPKGWRVGRLSDVLKQRVDRTKPSANTEQLPYVPIECITSKSVFLVESRPGIEAQSSLTLFRKGDIVFGAMRPYFHKVCLAPFDGVTRTTAFVLAPIKSEIAMFGLFQMFDDRTIEFATNHSEGSTIPYAKWASSMENMGIVVPPDKMAAAFGEIVDGLMRRGMQNTEQSLSLAELRDTLLPRLISGKLRLPETLNQLEDTQA